MIPRRGDYKPSARYPSGMLFLLPVRGVVSSFHLEILDGLLLRVSYQVVASRAQLEDDLRLEDTAEAGPKPVVHVGFAEFLIGQR